MYHPALLIYRAERIPRRLPFHGCNGALHASSSFQWDPQISPRFLSLFARGFLREVSARDERKPNDRSEFPPSARTAPLRLRSTF